MYELRILDSAAKELAQFDKSIAGRIVKRINWLAANLDEIHPESLSGDLAGLNKLRAGDYRIIYESLSEEKAIVIHAIGHRKDIYRKK